MVLAILSINSLNTNFPGLFNTLHNDNVDRGETESEPLISPLTPTPPANRKNIILGRVILCFVFSFSLFMINSQLTHSANVQINSISIIKSKP